MTDSSEAGSGKPDLAERREQLELLSRTPDREAHILLREPEALPSHLHNMLFLDEGEAGPAGPLLARAREALTGISLDGSFIVSASWDKTLKVWDAETGQERATLTGHTAEVPAWAVSPDGSFIVSASRDKTLRIWDAHTGQERATLSLPDYLFRVALDRHWPFTACAGGAGGPYVIDLVGIQYGPIVATAADFGQGPTVRCPACLQDLPLEEGWLGQEITCPRPGCDRHMRVNPFVVGPPQKASVPPTAPGRQASEGPAAAAPIARQLSKGVDREESRALLRRVLEVEAARRQERKRRPWWAFWRRR